MTMKPYNRTEDETKRNREMVDLLNRISIPQDRMLDNLGLFVNRQLFSHFLFLDEMYRKILDVNGICMEFGTRWGRNMAHLSCLRGIYEPYNYTRKLVAFDTFTGFPSVHEKDGGDESVKPGTYAVGEDYVAILERILDYHEKNSPIPHVKKFEIVKGDVTNTLEDYLNDHPETVIAFAYFDLDLYEPTKYCMSRILPHLTRGSVIGVDELNSPPYPGETLAFKEVPGLNKVRLRRSPFATVPSYFVYE